MMRRRSILRDRQGSAAVEMALVTPLLLIILFGSVEVGNFFYNEHLLSKAVRDGARFAARQNFSYYTCSGAPTGTVVADTRKIVKTGYLTPPANSDRLYSWNDSTITLDTRCDNTLGLTGIYRGKTTGAPIVTVSATVPYRPIARTLFGFSGVGVNLNATQRAAVTGL